MITVICGCCRSCQVVDDNVGHYDTYAGRHYIEECDVCAKLPSEEDLDEEYYDEPDSEY